MRVRDPWIVRPSFSVVAIERVSAHVSVRPRTVLSPGARFGSPAHGFVPWRTIRVASAQEFTEANSLRAIHARVTQQDTAWQAYKEEGNADLRYGSCLILGASGWVS
jgi:hypothetical protein